MGNFFKVGGVAFADCDKTLTITPLEGINANIPFELKSAASFSYTNDGDVERIRRTGSPAAGGLAVTEADADFEFEISLGEKYDLRQHIGPGAGRVACVMKCTWQRKGLQAMTVETGDGEGKKGGYCYLTKGLGGGETESGGKPTATVGGAALEFLENGNSIWVKPPA